MSRSRGVFNYRGHRASCGRFVTKKRRTFANTLRRKQKSRGRVRHSRVSTLDTPRRSRARVSVFVWVVAKRVVELCERVNARNGQLA